MDQDLKKIKKAALLMKNMGILSLKLPNLELQLSPTTLLDREQEVQPHVSTESEAPKPTYSDEDLLLWSAPGAFQDEVSH